ncbi:conserved hypothetical protein [Alteromonas macleodii]|jgi:hypothetical protein
MNLTGYERITVNGLNFYMKTEGLALVESIEKILMSRKCSPIQKWRKVKNLLDSQHHSVLSDTFMLYAHHLENKAIKLTDGQRGVTQQIMHMVAEVCLKKAKHEDPLSSQRGRSQ